jgi:hypothetical protein
MNNEVLYQFGEFGSAISRPFGLQLTMVTLSKTFGSSHG